MVRELADVRTHHSLRLKLRGTSQRSTLRNQLVNRFRLPLFRSTISQHAA
jgi:hypothetical protein